jgi:subtilisin family serine protease
MKPLSPTMVRLSQYMQTAMKWRAIYPAGDRVKFSGNSMASPNAANLAAKIIAVNPKLSPTQVIEIIRATADKTADGGRNLINPKKTIEATPVP